MKASDIPAKWAETWAKNAPLTNVTAIPQTSATPGFASQDQGFPPECSKPIAAGGIPPRGQDMNGALQFVSAWTRWQAAGGPVPWDSGYSSAIGGYPQGTLVLSATTFGAAYVSLVDDNATNPDAGGANWQPVSLFGTATTGDVKLSYKTAADFGWLPMNDGSIGSATSGATYQNADAQPLFSLMFLNMTDSNAPLLTSAGAGTNRAAFSNNPATAWAANARLVLPKTLGRALFAAGNGSGLTVNKALGQNGGAESMVANQLPPHTHGYQQNLFPQALAPGGNATVNLPLGTVQTDNGPGTSQPFLPTYASLNVFVKK